jgi:hypothetical protein
MEAQLDTLSGLWSAAGMGVTVGAVTFIDNTALKPSILPGAECEERPPGDKIRVTAITRLTVGASTWGFACLSGEVVLLPGRWLAANSQYLLAHEIGHTFSLLHTPGGLMAPNPVDQVRTIELGAVFWAHFDGESILNTIYRSQSVVDRRDCQGQLDACPPALFPSLGLYSLGAPVAASAVR